jgi:hypothetical protein
MRRHIPSLAQFFLACLLSTASSKAFSQDRPDLFVLSVGIDRYQNPKANLAGCVNDAVGMADLLKRQEGKRFGKVHGAVFTDQDANAAEVLAALKVLSAKGKAGDWIVIVLSGHGGIARNEWSFQAHDGRPISETALIEAADQCASEGKIAWILIDACQAGQLRYAAASVLNRHRQRGKGGIVLMVSSMSEQMSNALGRYSAFARAVEEGLGGDADFNDDTVVTLAELRRYTFRRVYDLILKNRVFPGLTVEQQDSAIDASLSVSDDLALTHAAKTTAIPVREDSVSERVDIAERTWRITVPGTDAAPATTFELRLDPFGFYAASLKQGLRLSKLTTGKYSFRGDSLLLTHAQGTDRLEIVGVTPTEFHYRFNAKEWKASLGDASPSDRIVDEAGTLISSDPRDRIRKGSPHKVREVSLERGVPYVIDLMSPEFDAFLRIEDEAGVTIAENDDGGFGTDARLTYTPSRSGKYRVVVTTFQGGAGNYHLHVEKRSTERSVSPNASVVVFQESFSLRPGDPVDRLNAKANAREHRMELKGGTSYSVELASNEFDAFLRIEDDENHPLTEDDDSGGNLNAKLLFTPARTGAYRMIATSFQRGHGRYTLTVREFPRAGGSKEDAIGEIRSLPFSAESRVAAKVPGPPGNDLLRKTFVMTSEAGKTYSLMVESKEFAPLVRVEDAEGRLLAFAEATHSGNRATLSFALADSIRCRIVVLPSRASGEGVFRISVIQAPAPRTIDTDKSSRLPASDMGMPFWRRTP